MDPSIFTENYILERGSLLLQGYVDSNLVSVSNITTGYIYILLGGTTISLIT